MPVMPTQVRISPALRRHVYARFSDDLRQSSIATISGFPHATVLSRQLRHPFTETKRNRERWIRVAEIVGYEGDPFVDPLPQLAEVSGED